MENRYLRLLAEKLVPRLEAETEALRQSFPERTFRVWGSPYGPVGVHQRYGAGIATDTHTLMIDISEVCFLPCLTVTLHTADGGISGSAIWAKPLGALRDLPQMLTFFKAALRGSDSPDSPFPFVEFVRAKRLECAPSTALEMAIFSSALDYLRQRYDLVVPAVDVEAKAVSPRATTWTKAAHAVLVQHLPGLRDLTVDNFYLHQSSLTLTSSSGLAIFTPQDDRPELAWSEYYQKYPHASGRLRFTRPGLDPEAKQALLGVRLICEPDFAGVVPRQDASPRPGVSFHRLLLLNKEQGWEVSAECDDRATLAVDEKMRFDDLSNWFSRPEIAACLGLESITLETLCPGRYDLQLRRGRWQRQVAIVEQSWVRQEAQEEIYIVDRPVAVVSDLDRNAAVPALLQLLQPWEDEIRQA